MTDAADLVPEGLSIGESSKAVLGIIDLVVYFVVTKVDSVVRKQRAHHVFDWIPFRIHSRTSSG